MSLNVIRLTFLCLFVSCLSACGPIYQTNYSYVPPGNPQGKMCLNQCLALQNSCQAVCQQQNTACQAVANQQAQMQYHDYIKQQKANGQPVKLNVNDFLNDSQCQQSCDCTGTYNQCYANCGGVVNTTQTCVAFCGDGSKN